jgi:hypothetical protein
MIKKLITNKLFFGKWPFKVETCLKGTSLIKRLGFEGARKWCTGDAHQQFNQYTFYKTIHRVELKEYIDLLEPFIGPNLQMRSEYYNLNFYTDDRKIYEGLQQQLAPWVCGISEPKADELDFLQNNSNNIILCDKLPYGKFKHKLYIGTSMPQSQRENFLKWLNNYNGDIRASQGSVGWMLGHKPYFQNPFIYVEDKKTLAMVGLFLGNYAKKTQEFVVRNGQKDVK